MKRFEVKKEIYDSNDREDVDKRERERKKE